MIRVLINPSSNGPTARTKNNKRIRLNVRAHGTFKVYALVRLRALDIYVTRRQTARYAYAASGSMRGRCSNKKRPALPHSLGRSQESLKETPA